jgi:Domain of unknown function (DUF3362)
MLFMQTAADVATCMYYTGIDPFTQEEVYVARNLRDRKMQRALLQFFKPENYFEVRQVLIDAGRADLIGKGCDALIPAHPPKEALHERRARANRDSRGGQEKPAGQNAGYRPARRSHGRRSRDC